MLEIPIAFLFFVLLAGLDSFRLHSCPENYGASARSSNGGQIAFEIPRSPRKIECETTFAEEK
jgi:hypothetical protein